MNVRDAAKTRGLARQRGLALLLLLVLSGLAAVIMIYNLLPSPPADEERELVTQRALARAKDALIAYVVANIDRDTTNQTPGFLPCPARVPDTANNEGYEAFGDCGGQNVSQIGRLPWKTLGVAPIRDASGECLWYAVSGNFKEGVNYGAKLLNWDTPGQFEVLAADGVSRVAGTTPENRAAAVIIAPGAPMGGQDRVPLANTNVCPGNYAPGNYLEADQGTGADNSSASATLVTPPDIVGGGYSRLISGRVDPDTGIEKVNDRMVVVTPDEIFAAIERRRSLVGTVAAPGILRTLTERVGECMAEFPSDFWPAPSTDRHMLSAGNLVPGNFALNSNYNEQPGEREGRVPAYTYDADKVSVLGDEKFIESHCSHWPQIRNWFQHWKDHLFYAVANEFEYTGTTEASNTICTGTCLSVNGSGAYPAVVIFAGKRLTAGNQVRRTRTDRGDPKNYLEGMNLLRFTPRKSGVDYANGPASDAFDDLVYCVQFKTVGADTRVPEVGPC
ncbi:MAG: hypothetical protein GC151_06665 [Betaproteobacteria bacterium]|nr:hypothetical protein [Betaproteobacteria bacterium]